MRTLPVSVPVMAALMSLSITTKAMTPITIVTNPRTDITQFTCLLGRDSPYENQHSTLEHMCQDLTVGQAAQGWIT